MGVPNNDCQRGVCGVGSTDFDSWVTDPAWEREALAATKAAEQHYIKCLDNRHRSKIEVRLNELLIRAHMHRDSDLRSGRMCATSMPRALY